MQRKTRKRKKRITLGNLALFFLVLAIISIIIAYFLTQSEQHQEKSATTTPAYPAQTTTNASKANFPLNGTWASDYDGSILDIHGTSFRIEQPSVDSHHVEKGNIFISGNTITFVYTDSSSLCKGKPGIYFFTRRKGRLILKLKTDICPGRKEKFATEWDSI